MTLNDKINKIAGTVKELAGAIEGQYEMEPGTLDKSCVGFEDYPKLVREIPSKSGGMSLTTVFAYAKGDNYEVYPDGGSFNPETGSIEYPEGWSDGNFIARNRSAQAPIWQSHAIFSSNGEMMQTWTPPVRITGMDGAQGPAGPQGEQGPQGPQGEQGPAGGGDGVDGYRMQFIYTRVADESVVSTVRPPESVQEDDAPDGWTNNPMGVTPALKVELVSQREKENDVWGEWSDPAIWAMYGKIGRDGNGVEYIYKLTEDETVLPGQPVAPAEGDEQYPADWSDDPLSVTPTNTVCWVSTRKQHYVDEKHVWEEYSVPTVWAKYGKDGKDGGGRTIFIYTGSKEFEPSPAIQTPQGGYWDVTTNTLSNVKSTDNYQWDVNPPKKTENTRFIWQSVGSFNSAGNLIGSWSEPFCITGENGTDGADGVSKEFIYRRLPSKEFLQDLKDYLVQNPLENVDTNKVPGTYDSICESNWSDEPLGIDGIEYLLEVVCSRKALFDDNGKFIGWGKWSTPTIWAMWGEDGNDGPGVEYIFLVTSDTYETNGEIKEVTSNVVLTNFMPDLTEMMSHERYQEPEFVPNDDFGYEGYDWTDEPSDIGPKEPMEWVSIRKGVVNQETGEVTWGPFSEPKLWAKYSQDGYAYKTSYVFARGEEVDQPHGGDFQHAYPTVDGTDRGERHPDWFDSVPEGTGSIWMSMRTFRSDNNSFDDDWSEPRKMTDTASLQVEFTAKDLSLKPGYKPANFGDFAKKYSTLEEAEGAWRKAEETENGVVWYDDVPNALYMATAVMHDDVWKDWVVVKIKGEQGDAGKDGTSVEFKGAFATLAKLKEEWDKYVAGDTTAFGGSLQMGDGYIIETLGEDEVFNLYVYSGGKDPDNTTFDANWKGFNIKGEKGDKAVLYIRYSDDGFSFTYPDGTTPGKYVGTLIGNGELDESIVNDPNSYKPWHLWNGEDGWGQEQIFVLTTDKYDLSNPPVLPDNNSSDPEYYPNHNLGEDAPGTTWCDVPQSVSEKYPYCWVATRKGEGNTFGEWKGTEEGHAVLYSRFSYDGNSAHYLELSEDQIVVPLDGELVDPDFINLYKDTPLTVQMSLYAGDDTIENQAKYSINVDKKYASCHPDTGLITIVAAELGSIDEIKCTATYNNKPFTKTLYIHKTNAAYELSVNKSVLRRDPYNENLLVPEDQLVKVTVKKWNGSGWIYPDSKLIHAKLTKIGGAEDVFIETDHVSWSDNVAEFDFSDEMDLAKVRFYVDGTEIFEEVGVIANGEDGVSQEYIYINSKRELTDSEKESLRPNPTDLNSAEFQKPDYYPTDVVTTLGFAWTDNSLGVSEEVPCEYVSSRKKKNGKWGAFSKLSLWAKYGEKGPQGDKGDKGDPTWSWRLSDPIEMISYNSDGTLNGTINASTTVLANCGGHVGDVQITEVTDGYGSYNGDTFTLNKLPKDGSDFTIMIKAKGTWGDYTDEAELRYTVKKWFGEPATVQIHLSNDSTPVLTDSNGNYAQDIVRKAKLTASSGTNPVTITGVYSPTDGVDVTLTGNELEITVSTEVTGWSNDVLTVPIDCTLEGYDTLTVIMSFYKVRAAKDAEYPDIYDLLVNPTSILVSVNQETGEANYETTTVTPTIIKYTATNETKVLTVSEFNKLNVGSIEYSFDGSNNVHTLSGDTFTILGKDDADEYVDVVMKITGGKTQTERILISHDPIPNIDWELELNCPERILYKSDKTTQITNVKNVACRLYKTVGGVKNYVDIPQDYFGFDIELYLDGVQQTSPYTIDDIIALDKFINSCEFVLVNQGGEGEEDVVWDRKLVTKEYAEAGTPGAPALTAQLTNPASIVQYSGRKFLNSTVETDMFVRLGSAEQIIQKIEIESIKKNGSDLSKDYITCVPSNLGTKRPTIKFTLTDNITVESQVITIDIKATVGDTITIVETKTIKIETAGGESVALLDFTNDYLPVKLNAGDGYGFPVHTGVRVYYGTQLCNISELTLDFNGSDIPNNYDSTALWSFDNNVLTFEKDFPGYLEDVENFPMEDFSLNITAKANVNGIDLDLSGELNFNAQYGDSAFLSIFPDVINYANGAQIDIKVVEPDGTELDYNGWKDKYEVRIDNNKLITSSLQQIESNRENPVNVALHLNNRLIDRETLPILKDGADYEGYHIIPNHYEITYDPDGNVRTPNENIYPIITYQKGSNYVKLKDSEWSAYGLTVKYTIDGGGEQTYSNSIVPSTIKEQLKFYLYESGKQDWRDYTEVDVTYEHEGPEGPQGPSGSAGESTLVYDFTNNHIPVVPHMKDYGLGGAGTDIHVYYGLTELPLEAHNDDETGDEKCLVVKYGDDVVPSSEGEFSYWGFNEGIKMFSFGAGLIDWLMTKNAKAEYWKFDITVQVTVGGETKKLTKGLYLYKAESLRPTLYTNPNVIKAGETEELKILVFGADNNLVDDWYNNGYTIKINKDSWTPGNDSKYPIGENPVSLDIVLYKDGKFADAETIPVLRDGVDGSIDEEQKQQIINALIAEANKNIEAAKTDLNNTINTETQNLRNALFDGEESAIAKATSALTLANNAGQAVTTLEALLKNASGVDEGSVLKVDDLYNLSVAALGSKAGDIVGDNDSYADALWAKNLVALVGTFVDIKAENIGAGTISGNTLQSSEPISEGDNRPKWILENDGSGYLANDHIRWTKDGNLTIDGVPVVTEDKDRYATLQMREKDVFTLYQDDNNGHSYYIHAEMPFEAPAITATSDMTLKDVVKDVELSVDELANAPTFVFDWKDGSGRSVGTSAQYWQDVLPEAVLKGGNDKLSLAYGNTALVGMISLARTVREQNEKIAKLESLVEGLLNKLY